MRETVGKLVCIWSPVLHGEGCSTVTDAVGFALHHYTGKKILILNKSSSLSLMETYIAKDIEIKYSLDNLKIFRGNIKSDHINTYATQISEGLYMVAGSRINREITGENKGFEELFIKRCLEGFELVVADINTGIREDNVLYLNRADLVLTVTSPNEIILDEIFLYPQRNEIAEYLQDEGTVLIFNRLYEGWDTARVVARMKKKYGIRNAFGLNFDGDVFNACCMNLNFYSFMSRELERGKSPYAHQISDICEYIVQRLYPEEQREEIERGHRRFGRLLKSGMF